MITQTQLQLALAPRVYRSANANLTRSAALLAAALHWCVQRACVAQKSTLASVL